MRIITKNIISFDAVVNNIELLAAVKAFASTVDDLYGHYLDCTMGFGLNEKLMADIQAKRREMGMSGNFENMDFIIGPWRSERPHE